MSEPTFPRQREGFACVDHGEATVEQCPNCQSRNFRSSVSIEWCPDCGIQCDYWGEGANEAYREFERRKRAAYYHQQAMDQIRADQEAREEYE